MNKGVKIIMNLKINKKVINKLEDYDEEVQELIKKGINYTERAQLTRVKNRLSKDIDRIVKEQRK